MYDDIFDGWDDDIDPPTLTLEVTDPEVLGYLLGPRGERIATLLDRPWVPFGFQSANP